MSECVPSTCCVLAHSLGAVHECGGGWSLVFCCVFSLENRCDLITINQQWKPIEELQKVQRVTK
ncbi:hypothetical protein H8959_016853 [Pygathrix nigripes]